MITTKTQKVNSIGAKKPFGARRFGCLHIFPFDVQISLVTIQIRTTNDIAPTT